MKELKKQIKVVGNLLFDLTSRIFIKFILGDEKMMAMLFAQRVILEKMTFSQVPNSLKPQVYEILVDCGMQFLAEDYVPVGA